MTPNPAGGVATGSFGVLAPRGGGPLHNVVTGAQAPPGILRRSQTEDAANAPPRNHLCPVCGRAFQRDNHLQVRRHPLARGAELTRAGAHQHAHERASVRVSDMRAVVHDEEQHDASRADEASRCGGVSAVPAVLAPGAGYFFNSDNP